MYVYGTKGKRLSVVHDDENGHTYYYLNSNWGRSLNQDIPFRFWFDDYDDVSTKYRIDANQVERVIEQACISYDDFDKYVGDRENIYGWHIKKLEIFDKPMQLNEFYKDSFEQCEYSPFDYDNDLETCLDRFRIKRAPQSYQHVWVKE